MTDSIRRPFAADDTTRAPAASRPWKDHIGRRRAVHVARRVEASTGSCVYSSPTAVTAKPAAWREAGHPHPCGSTAGAAR